MRTTIVAPRLRFPEFKDGWNLRTLEEVAAINPKSNGLPEIFTYIDLDSVVEGLLLKRNQISVKHAPSRAQRLLKRNDIIYQTVRPYQRNNYYFDIEDDKYVASTGYAQIRAKEDGMFLYQLLHTSSFVNKVLTWSTGTNYPAINSNDLAKIAINVPSGAEQKKIAQFLKLLDEKIQYLETKASLLTRHKQGIIQQVFSQDIQFKVELGKSHAAWQEVSLEQVLEPGSKKPVLDTSTFKKITIKLNKQGLVFSKTSRKMADTRPFYIRNKGEIIIGKQNYFNGSIAVVSEEFDGSICSNAIMSFNPKKEVNVDFLYEYISTPDFLNKRAALANGTGQKELSERDFLDFKIYLPDIEEQVRIARFIKVMNKKIAIETDRLKHTKLFKDALLQRMFV